MTQIRPLDGFRGLAALMVMWFHYFQLSHHSGDSIVAHWLHRLMNIGQGGVDLFFVLSGFLITRILLATRDDSQYLKRFYARRTLRIFPLYFFFMFLFIVTTPLLDGRWSSFSENWYFWVFAQNLPHAFGWPVDGPVHYWSLAVEEQFYLVWPFLVAALSRRMLVRVAMALVIVPFVLRIVLIPMGVDVYFLTITRCEGLALGALLAIFEPRIVANRGRLAPRFRQGLVVALPLLVVGFALFGGQMHYAFRVVKFTLIATTGALVVGYLLTNDAKRPAHRFFSSRFMVFTGKISFGLYVYQTLCFTVFDRLVPNFNSVFRMPVAFAIVYGVAWLSFRYFESPILALKRYFDYDRKPGQDSAPPAAVPGVPAQALASAANPVGRHPST